MSKFITIQSWIERRRDSNTEDTILPECFREYILNSNMIVSITEYEYKYGKSYCVIFTNYGESHKVIGKLDQFKFLLNN